MTRQRPRCVARWACLFACFPIPVAYATGSSYIALWAEDYSDAGIFFEYEKTRSSPMI